MTDAEPSKSKAQSGWISFLLDFGPLVAFFTAFKLAQSDEDPFQGILIGTITFMVAITAAIVFSVIAYKKVTPMQWISAVLILGFGALTVYLHDPVFIQIKPTIIYLGFAALLLGGWLRGTPMLRYAFAAAFQGLTEKGWLKLSRNWGLFFVFMALANEAMRASLSFEMWLTVKTWGLTVLSLLFGIANIPMLLKHGFTLEEASEAAAPPAGGE
ncbi:inner membrane-spanning protein YciB [Parasphingopyxis marina]|uniref:Inner membrane-spanning protein YciB n=1 Tax=Parasphingopyxis marina TaxID=2761622 RepID=A0A842HUM4_9SPHN|nr:inner membrane-spanning protein YciB [Parasphingopyxis marina]MBC2777688.1 septation protein IspZ [Parasphingopyxis marina]